MDRDLVKWLENKLGDELWNGRTAAGLLSGEMIAELDSCFQDLQSNVKLRLLLSIPHLSHRNLSQWRDGLGNLLSLALQDADDWVETVADLLKDYSEDGCISFVPNDPASHFSRTLIEIRKIVQDRSTEGDLRLLPPDTTICSKCAIQCRFGAHQETTRHFALRRRPQSAILKADMIRKAAETINQSKNKQPSTSMSSLVPIRSRNPVKRVDNSGPMRGIPSQNTIKLSSGFTNEPRKARSLLKRDGGAKLIDIDETPQAMKKKMKETEAEHKAQRAVDREEARKRIQEEKEAKKAAANRPPAPLPIVPDVSNKPSTSTAPLPLPRSGNEISSVTPSLPSYAAVQLQPTVSFNPVPVHRPAPTNPLQGISIPREVLTQAEEMFRDANKLSRQERILILGFMAGNRENPCPQMGQILTVRLSECHQQERCADGTIQVVLVETFFQMNYDNGEWKRLKKIRPLRREELVTYI